MKVWDLHCDTLSELRYAMQRGEEISFAKNNLHIDLEKLKQGDYFLQCFAAYIHLGNAGADPLQVALEEIAIFDRLMETYADEIAPVYCAADIQKNFAQGKRSAMLTVEEAGCCMGNLDALRLLYEKGARMMSLTWNFENAIAHPNSIDKDPAQGWPPVANTTQGLKPEGFAFVEEMERLHMIVDVSHLSDKGFWDLARCAKRPFIASHSNCRALNAHCRNLTDEMIVALANQGGIAGVNYFAGFLDNQPTSAQCYGTVAQMVQHVAHFKKIGGIEMIALGSDFDGINDNLELKNAGQVQVLAHELHKAGFTDDEIEAVFYRNAMRFFVENL